MRYTRLNKIFYKITLILLVLSTALTIYTFLQPTTTTVQTIVNTSQIDTRYEYKAEITPNVLYPNGGQVDMGNTLFGKITTAIPVNLKSTIYSKREVSAAGTHEVQLLIKAGESWERKFPLGQKQAFKQSGTIISILKNTYKIDLGQVKSFIRQVEDETGISPSQYTLEILPNIEGTIMDAGVEKNFQIQDRLVFQYSINNIVLASEKNFTSRIAFSSSQVGTNNLTVFGQNISLSVARSVSIVFSILLLVGFIFMYRSSKMNSSKTKILEIDRINKRYANRIIPVSQKINITQKSIFALDSFNSILKIADEKESPIFANYDQKGDYAVFFIIDGDYLFTYETKKTTIVPDVKNPLGSDEAYARG